MQPDVCNGCGYCVVSCPFGVVQRNPEDGRAFKCTFCYDRQKVGLNPACAQACPTESIKFGPIDRAADSTRRNACRNCRARGMDDAQLYDPRDTSVEGIHAMFIVRGDPRQYNLPPKPEVPTIYQQGWMDWIRCRRRPAAVWQPVRISGERQTMSTDPIQPTASNSQEWARENRLLEIRREAEKKGRVQTAGVRPAGAPVSHGVP